MDTRPQSGIILAALVTTALGVSACTWSTDAPASVGQSSTDASGDGEQRDGAVLKDVTQAGVAMADDTDLPKNLTTRTWVPWDSEAILEVSTGAEHKSIGTGALIIRYGKSRSIDQGHASAIYLLEPAGATIEPIAIQWQPNCGYELRAIARVDGTLRRYDIDR